MNASVANSRVTESTKRRHFPGSNSGTRTQEELRREQAILRRLREIDGASGAANYPFLEGIAEATATLTAKTSFNIHLHKSNYKLRARIFATTLRNFRESFRA